MLFWMTVDLGDDIVVVLRSTKMVVGNNLKESLQKSAFLPPSFTTHKGFQIKAKL